MKANEITIDVKANLEIDRSTAEACLKLVELYVNKNDLFILVDKLEDGTMVFRFDLPHNTGMQID